MSQSQYQKRYHSGPKAINRAQSRQVFIILKAHNRVVISMNIYEASNLAAIFINHKLQELKKIKAEVY